MVALVLALIQAGPARSPAPDPFAACLTRVAIEAHRAGIADSVTAAAFRGVTVDSAVLLAAARQPEFTLPIWDYLAAVVDSERVADGRERLLAWAPVLDRIEASSGVDRHVLVAIWGVETDFGRVLGGRSLVRSLATGACHGRRQAFFTAQLVAVLEILASGDIAPGDLIGSWAGAFGQTQFMPTTYRTLAVDGDGDARRDIVGSIPDALASSANYLRRAGWSLGEDWGYEVKVPGRYRGRSGPRYRQPAARWAALGIRRVDGRPLDGAGTAALLRPAGPRGPAFLVFRNWRAIHAYNPAGAYALAVAHLADRMRGRGDFITPWPTTDRGLSRVERREVQERLRSRGHDVGQADGVIGSKTRAAIERVQAELGLPVDGRAGGNLLDALRAAAPGSPYREPTRPPRR